MKHFVRNFAVLCISVTTLISARIATGDSPLPQPHYRLTRTVSGWLPYWVNKDATGEGWKSVRANIKLLDQVSFFSASVDGSTGELTGNFGPNQHFLNEEIAELHEQDVAALVTVTHFNHLHDVLANRQSLDNISNGIVRLIDSYNLDGVDIDFEDFADKDAADTDRFTQFIASLSDQLHKHNDTFGYPLTVIATILARTQRGHFTYADETALANTSVDQVRIMAYDEYSPGSAKAGACAPLPWVHEVADYLRNEDAPSWKFVLGVPGYGYRWPVKADDNWTTLEKGRSVTYLKAQALITTKHTPRLWDNVSNAPYLSYVEDGKRWVAYYEDSESWYRKIDQEIASNSQPLGGMAEWALGFEDPSSWPRIKTRLRPTYPIYSAIGLCYTHYGGGARFGEPISPETDCGAKLSTTWNGRSGRKQRFRNAEFYYKWGEQRAYYLDGSLMENYDLNGGPDGLLGFPIADETVDANGMMMGYFENGTIQISKGEPGAYGPHIIITRG